MTILEEIRNITNSHEALVAMEAVACCFNIAFDDILGCWKNRDGKTVSDCDNQKSMYEDGYLVFGWDDGNTISIRKF